MSANEFVFDVFVPPEGLEVLVPLNIFSGLNPGDFSKDYAMACAVCGQDKCDCADKLKPFAPQQNPKDRDLPRPTIVPTDKPKKP